MRMFIGFFIPALLGFFAVASAQLPPEIIADKYLMQAEQLHAKKDYVAALNMMDKAIALQKEHNLTLPVEFPFKYAQVAFSVGSMQTALDAVSKYLSVGRGSVFYKEALALLIEIEEKIEEEIKKFEFSPEKTCDGKPLRSSCWMVLASHPECYVWESEYYDGQTVTWSGECSGGFAEGEGTLVEIHTSEYIGVGKIELTGRLQNGKMHGQWIIRTHHGRFGTVIEKGPYVNGKRHGLWATLYGESEFGNCDFEGPYLNDKLHGEWVYRARDGRRVGGGTYVDGKAQGKWIDPFCSDGTQWEGPYVDGKRHGQWVYRRADGTIGDKTTYVNGEEQ
ncbi:MAG: hypothetical protein OXH16_09200 [Gemmatimonadetes bacterium]|nr:hypothetical protein [Gemmatimonadota bacterium]